MINLSHHQAEKNPATITYNYNNPETLGNLNFLCNEKTNELQAFVIPNILTKVECLNVINHSEEYGISPVPSTQGTLRTAKRTINYQYKDLSDKVFEKLDLKLLEKQDGYGKVYGLCENWRVLRYDKYDSFCAHQDQMDSFQLLNKETGIKDLIISTHTLLIQLSSTEEYSAATRFYPNLNSTKRYDYSIDVILPQGWGLVFRQRGLYHAGLPLLQGTKYVAQTGVLRLVPREKMIEPCVFKLGPGLTKVLENNQKKKGGFVVNDQDYSVIGTSS